MSDYLILNKHQLIFQYTVYNLDIMNNFTSNGDNNM